MDEIKGYQEAITKMEEAARRLDRLATVATQIATNLSEWKNLTLSNLEGVSIPGDVGLSKDVKSVDCSQWVSAIGFRDALNDYYTKRRAARDALNVIPDDIKKRWNLTRP